jgi:hypothetical protein
MTTLATHPVDDPDQLALIGDDWTPLAVDLAEAFRSACRQDALAHNGYVNPNRVSLLLRSAVGEFNPRWFSARWAPACSAKGFLDKTDVREPIDAAVSRGNGNKDVLLRKWRGWSA